MSTAILGIEGVLAQVSREGLMEAPIISVGVQLAEGLSTQYSIVYITSIPDERLVKTWLTSRRILTPSAVLGPWSHPIFPEREHRIKEVRQGGTIVDLVVDADPEVCGAAVEQGVNAMLFVAVKQAWTYRPPREDPTVPWNEMLTNIRRNRELHTDQDVDDAMEMGRPR